MEAPPSVNNQSKRFTLINGNKIFKAKIYLSSNIKIEAYEVGQYKEIFCSKILSLEYLVKLSKGFRVCEDIKEAYDILIQIFENEMVSIDNITENDITLIFKVYLPAGKIQEANLTMKKKEIENNIIIEELVEHIDANNKNLKKLEKENSSLKNRIEILSRKSMKVNTKNKKNFLLINIEVRSYHTQTYKFNPSDTIQYMIETVKKDFNISKYIELRYNNLLIDNYSLTFEDYKIPDDATIDFNHYKYEGQYFIKTISGKTITVDLVEKDTMENVKAKIRNKEGILSNLQTLMFEGKILEDNRTMEDYRIRNGSTLHLILKLR